ncbi:terminase large subunit domain-containing protein [Hyphococcus sp.]|uniref:terminase large subunit domain-containing protein n=1 Tax=Hyphococcus sp. TaxID=2038636 RepID=UPI0035C71789
MQENNSAQRLDLALNPLAIFEKNELQPLPFQADLMNLEYEGQPANQFIIVASRRSGKTSSAGGLCIYRANQFAESVIVACPNESHARNFIRVTKQLALGAGLGSDMLTPKVLELEFKSGGRIHAVQMQRDGAAARGLTGDIILAEEAVLIEDAAATEALIPILASAKKPKFIAITTAGPKRGWLFDWWADEEDKDAIRIRLSAYDVPHIDKTWLEKQRRRMTSQAFSREYLAMFGVGDDDSFIEPEILDRIIQPKGTLNTQGISWRQRQSYNVMI